jgi:hypothetical protein
MRRMSERIVTAASHVCSHISGQNSLDYMIDSLDGCIVIYVHMFSIVLDPSDFSVISTSRYHSAEIDLMQFVPYEHATTCQYRRIMTGQSDSYFPVISMLFTRPHIPSWLAIEPLCLGTISCETSEN